MNAATAKRMLAAGGVVPAKTTVKTELPLDPLVARSWSHPAMNSPVVRVDLGALSVARDLEMEVLGFGAGFDRGPVAKSPRRSFGFPATAILEDPVNARYALDVLKAFKKAARQAKSKPGFAKADFDAIAETLGRSVPHYLPSFYEEACRVLLDQGNQGLAGQLFEKARVAERVHALKVDEKLRENTFVAFALAGALSIKSLTNYAKELLAGSNEPLAAYQTFRRVCVKRTMGGLPPFGAMNKELKRLAKAAGIDPNAEEVSLLTEILEAPSLARAGMSFFAPYTRAFASLAKESTTRDQLLEMFPAVGDGNRWLEFLEKINALDNLAGWSASRRRVWLEKLVAYAIGWRGHRDGRWLQLYVDALPALKEAGTFHLLHGVLDLDLLELLLANGIEVQLPERWSRIDLDEWIKHTDQPNRGCDPVCVAAHDKLLPVLLLALDRALGDPEFLEEAVRRQGFLTGIDQWLGVRLEELSGDRALPDLFDSLERLEANTTPTLWARFPERLAALQRARVAPQLAETLRIGLFDELGWAVLDDAAESFGVDAELVLSGFFPVATIGNSTGAIVLGPRERVAEIDLQLPTGSQVTGFRWVGGQLLTIFRRNNRWEREGVWSSNWNEAFACHVYHDASLPLLLENGRVLTADGLFSAGDRKVPGGGAVFTDGTHHWALGAEWPGVLHALSEEGRRGRKSRPDFFESFVEEGTTLELTQAWLTVLPPEITASPLGQKGVLAGTRLRTRDQDSSLKRPSFELERVDGATLDGEEHTLDGTPRYLLDLPGHERAVPIDSGMGLRRRDGVRGSSAHPNYRRGTRVLPEFIHWWHFFEPRDVPGSLALRAVTEEQAERLVEAGKQAYAAAERKHGERVFTFKGTDLETAVQTVLPEVTNPRLQRGIGGVCFMAGKDARRLEALQCVDVAVFVEADPPALAEAVADLADFGRDASALAEIRELHAVFAGLDTGGITSWALDGGPRTRGGAIVLARRSLQRTRQAPNRVFEDSSAKWWDLLEHRGALAYRALLATTSVEHRAALLELLQCFADSPVTVDPTKIRLFWIEESPTVHPDAHNRIVFQEGSSFFYAIRHSGTEYQVLEFNPTGAFRKPTAVAELHNVVELGASWGTPDEVALFAARATEPVDVEGLGERIAAVAGLTLNEARILAAGLPTDGAELMARFNLKATPFGFADHLCRGKSCRRTLLDAAFRIDPGGPWGEEFGAQIAQGWLTLNPTKLPQISADLALLLAADLREHNPHQALRSAFDRRGAFYQDAEWGFDDYGDVFHKGGFSSKTVEAALKLVTWLALNAPVGDVARQALPELVEAVNVRLRHPALLFPVGYVYEPSAQEQMRERIDGELQRGKDGPIAQTAMGASLSMISCRWGRNVVTHPRILETDPDQFTAVCAQLQDVPSWAWAVPFFGGTLDALVERVASTPLAAGAYECNPLESVPELVTTVAAAMGVAENTAAYYLQILVLPAPTDRAIRRWNGWSMRTFKEARAELIETERVLEAKRSRAGRTIFLPGGWNALKAPYMPVETWKMPFYLNVLQDGDFRMRLGVLLPFEPVHGLFERAWQRVEGGDAPRYEEVVR